LRDRPVALKILHPQLVVDPETVGLFREEAGTMANLDHPHIATVYEAGDIEGVRFIAMRYIPGRTLAQVITEDGPQPLEQVAVWLDQVSSALDYAHSQGILHRDIKSGNILLDRDGLAMVTDFGLARAVSASGGSASSQGRQIMSGTAKYMAPEQAKGKPVAQSDVYSLGVVLYELLTGQVPFDGDDPFAIAIRHMTEEPRSPRELRPGLPEPL
jgi:serine/threonine-protein kinase